MKLDLWEHAACRGQGNEFGNVWMYPGRHEDRVVEAALMLCARCPVKAECSAAAQREGALVGIRAGRVYGAGDNEGTGLRECVICGDSFKGRGPAKCCSGVCRLDWSKRQRKSYAAKRYIAMRSTRPVQTGVRSAATITGIQRSDPGAAGNGPGSDRKPLGGPDE